MDRLLLAALVALTLALGWTHAASAHTVTRADCVSVARFTIGSPAMKRAAALGCRRFAAAHALDHQHAWCQSLRGDYRVRNACTIRVTFGVYGAAAVRVARCESSLSTHAASGQYLGMFQMGALERATYGHGSSPRVQSESAYHYFIASGRDWSPWACQP